MARRRKYAHLETDDQQETFWLSVLGFGAGFVITAITAMTILGVGLNIRLGSTALADSVDVVGLVQGERIYTTTCASCHGANGEGKVGPAIGGGLVVEKYPFISTQIALITDGRGAMPSFANTLSLEEIEAVALYEREKLGQ